jgi:hypothetical protein
MTHGTYLAVFAPCLMQFAGRMGADLADAFLIKSAVRAHQHKLESGDD